MPGHFLKKYKAFIDVEIMAHGIKDAAKQFEEQIAYKPAYTIHEVDSDGLVINIKDVQKGESVIDSGDDD